MWLAHTANAIAVWSPCYVGLKSHCVVLTKRFVATKRTTFGYELVETVRPDTAHRAEHRDPPSA